MNVQSLGDYFEHKDNNLNLIRLIAALAVIYGHSSAITGNGPPDIFLQLVGYKFIGGVAVDVFFVISGFLITASAASGNGLIYYSASRILRIYPALVACVVLSVFVLGPALSTTDYWNSSQVWQYLWRNSTSYSTEYFLPGVFQDLHDKAINGSLWSLPIEIRLYVVIFFFAVIGILRSRALFNLAFFCIVVAGYLMPDLWAPIFHDENHRHVAMMFLIGSFAWINRESIPINPALLLLLLFFAASQHKMASFGVAYSIVIPYAVFYLSFAPGGTWFNRFGDYSYGVYLYGWISQQLVMTALPTASNAANTGLGCAMALCFAALSWHIVEKPALKYRQHFRTYDDRR